MRVATAAATGLGLVSLSGLGLGLAGALNTPFAWGLIIAGWMAGLRTLYTHRNRITTLGPASPLHAGSSGGDKRGSDNTPHAAPARSLYPLTASIGGWLHQSAGWNWIWILAVPFVAQALAGAVVPPGMLWNPEEPHGYDVVEYHLQVPREWYEAHRIIPLHHNAYGYFPFNVEIHYLLGMHLLGGPWAGMYLAHFMHLTFIILAVLAAYGFARRIGPAASANLAGAALLTVPWLTQLAAIAYDEGGFLLFGTLAIGWALAATLEPQYRLRRFALAGAMAGLAAGSKLTAVPEVLLAVPLVCAAAGLWMRLTHQRPMTPDAPATQTVLPPATPPRPAIKTANDSKHLVLDLALFCISASLCFGPWLVRNFIWTHNPVFPELMPLLGPGDFSPAQVTRWELAHQAPPPQQSITAQDFDRLAGKSFSDGNSGICCSRRA